MNACEPRGNFRHSSLCPLVFGFGGKYAHRSEMLFWNRSLRRPCRVVIHLVERQWGDQTGGAGLVLARCHTHICVLGAYLGHHRLPGRKFYAGGSVVSPCRPRRSGFLRSSHPDPFPAGRHWSGNDRAASLRPSIDIEKPVALSASYLPVPSVRVTMRSTPGTVNFSTLPLGQ